MCWQLDAKQMDDTVLEQLAMEARLRQRSARRRRQVAEQYVEEIVSSKNNSLTVSFIVIYVESCAGMGITVFPR